MISQRELDVMQLDAQLNIRQLVEEWRRMFFGNRAPPQPQLPTEIDGGLPGGGPEEKVPISEDVIGNLGGEY